MIGAGISEKVAMRISGRKTRSIFDRYNIVNDDDLRAAAVKVSNSHEDRGTLDESVEAGTNPRTIAISSYKKER
jgi:hypothetical protein